MKRVGLLLTVVAAAALATAVSAVASPAQRIELSESIDFVRPPGEPPLGTFTLSGLGGCESGTFVDQLVTANSGFTHIVVQRHYTCADGGGAFTAQLVLTIESDFATATETISVNWVIRDGTGALETLRGAGSGSGSNVNCNPRCTGGTSTVQAIVHLG
jgi:hypothetical protein